MLLLACHSSHGGISEHFSLLMEGRFSRSPLRSPHLLRSHWKNLIFCFTLPLSHLTSTARLPHYFQVLKISGKKTKELQTPNQISHIFYFPKVRAMKSGSPCSERMCGGPECERGTWRKGQRRARTASYLDRVTSVHSQKCP